MSDFLISSLIDALLPAATGSRREAEMGLVERRPHTAELYQGRGHPTFWAIPAS